MGPIWIVAKDDNMSAPIGKALRENIDGEVYTISDQEVQSAPVNLSKPDLLIVDVESVRQSADRLLESFSHCYAEAAIIVIVPAENQSTVAEYWPFGVDEIMVRPVNQKQMRQMTDSLLQRIATFGRLLAAQEKLGREMRQSQIVAKSGPMRAILQRLPRLAASISTVLITGETGAGKELITRAIHYLGPRAGHPFITIDCGAMPEQLIENELFGHARGAYTDAGPSSKGLIQEADGGTLFLDEVEALPLPAQSKFLRFLQERQYKPLGQSKYLSVNVRVLAATNTELAQAVEKKLFREDLYYRLNVIPLLIPPLRERKADIPALAKHFLQRYAEDLPTRPAIPDGTLRSWLDYDWPGNVRELENKVQEWLTTEQAGHWCDDASSFETRSNVIRPLAEVRHAALASCDRAYLHNLLTCTHGNISAAARIAGVDRKNLRELLKKYSMEAQRFRR